MHHRRNHFPQLEPSPEKSKVRAVADSVPIIHKWPVLPTTLLPHLGNRISDVSGTIGRDPGRMPGYGLAILRRRHFHCCPHNDQQKKPSHSPQCSYHPRSPVLVFSFPCSARPPVTLSTRPLSLPKKDRHNRAAFSCPGSISIIPPRAQPARRPYLRWSGHSAHRPDPPVLPAAEPSAMPGCLRASYRSRPASSLRSSPSGSPQL